MRGKDKMEDVAVRNDGKAIQEKNQPHHAIMLAHKRGIVECQDNQCRDGGNNAELAYIPSIIG